MRRTQYSIVGICITAICLSIVFASASCFAEQARSGNHQLEHWVINNGASEVLNGNIHAIDKASIGMGLTGTAVSNPRVINEIPTYENKLWTGFLFVAWFDIYLADDMYDIENLRCYEYEGGEVIEEATWSNDPDPFFTWTHKSPAQEVEGYTFEFDDLPDKIVDSFEPQYQTPDFFLEEGVHAFYVYAKSPTGAIGSVGVFEIWVDIHDPTIQNILPADGDVINDARPTIQATFQDNLSGIDPNSIELTITTETDTYQVLPTVDPDTGVVSYTPFEDFDDGLLTIFMSVRDKADNPSIPIFWTFTIDTVSPTGSISINNGNAATESNSMTLTIEAAEMQTEIAEMIISNDGVFDDEVWEPYVTTKENWITSTISGIKTVYVKFKDIAGNESDVFDDSIVLTVSTPNTYIIAAPPTITQDADALFKFTATIPGSEFFYKLDNGDWLIRIENGRSQ